MKKPQRCMSVWQISTKEYVPGPDEEPQRFFCQESPSVSSIHPCQQHTPRETPLPRSSAGGMLLAHITKDRMVAHDTKACDYLSSKKTIILFDFLISTR